MNEGDTYVRRFTEQGHAVYIVWKPHHPVCDHVINVLTSGALEVICCHPEFDQSAIREQIRLLLDKQHNSKKND